jgi:hypothetical protein
MSGDSDTEVGPEVGPEPVLLSGQSRSHAKEGPSEGERILDGGEEGPSLAGDDVDLESWFGGTERASRKKTPFVSAFSTQSAWRG